MSNQQMLLQSGVKIKMQDLLIDYLEDLGNSDAEKYFDETNTQLGGPEQGLGLQQSPAQLSPDIGMQNGIPAVPPMQAQQPMAGPETMQI